MEEFKIIQEVKNPLFNRTEFELEIETSKTPVRKEIEQFLSKKTSAHVEAIYVDTIKGKFGAKHFRIVARVYNSKEDKHSTEIKTQKQRKAEAEAAKAVPAETQTQ